MATTGASVAAAIVAKARRDVCDHFEQYDAFAPADAVDYEPPSRIHRTQFDALIGRGIVKPTGDGRYWFDRAAARADKERRRAAAIVVLKIVLIVFAITIAVVAITTALR